MEAPMQQPETSESVEVTSKEILSTILQHGISRDDQQLLCTMAMVCKDWQTAVLEDTPPGCLHVSVDFDSGGVPEEEELSCQGMQRLSSFALRWLPKHAKMVSSIQVEVDHDKMDDDGNWIPVTNQPWLITKAVAIFSQALSDTGAAAAAALAVKGAKPLGLESYSSETLRDSNILQALPAATLTQLTLQFRDGEMGELAPAFQHLTNLRRLEALNPWRLEVLNLFHSWWDDDDDGAFIGSGDFSSCMEAVSQLPTVTSLSFEGWDNTDHMDVTLVPTLLEELTLSFNGCSRVRGGFPRDFAHLTRLTSLSVRCKELAMGSRLPPQLLEFTFEYSCGYGELEQQQQPVITNFSNLTALSLLQSLSIINSREAVEDLLQLQALPRLQKLRLDCFRSPIHHIQLFNCIGSVSGLTSLTCSLPRTAALERAAVCHEIARLQNLRELNLGSVFRWPVKEQQLALQLLQGLMGLTKLEL